MEPRTYLTIDPVLSPKRAEKYWKGTISILQALSGSSPGEADLCPRLRGNVHMAWYVAHTKSGFEHKVKASIENQVKLRKLGNKIFRVVVPQEESLEVVKGQRRPVKHKVYPGYVFIEMEFEEDSWSLVKNTEGVTHFLGSTEIGKEPTPIKESEVQTILKRMGVATGPVVNLEVGDHVTVLIGPFTDFSGTIQEIDYDKHKTKVLLSVFGRETPVEFDFNQIEKIDED